LTWPDELASVPVRTQPDRQNEDEMTQADIQSIIVRICLNAADYSRAIAPLPHCRKSWSQRSAGNQHESSINRMLITSYVFLQIIGKKLTPETVPIAGTRWHRQVFRESLPHKLAKSPIHKTVIAQ
jgi:hypothetical protein